MHQPLQNKMQNSHDFRMDNLLAPPIIEANIDRAMPRIQSWAVTTVSDDISLIFSSNRA